MTKNDPRKALGKGLHSLLPNRGAQQHAVAAAVPQPTTEPVQPAAPKEGDVQRVPIDQVHPNPNQPRREFDEAALMELMLSIERDGIIQPIIVRKTADKQFQIIAGERRWRAASGVGLKEVPVIVRSASDEQVLELAIVENIQREDLNPIELALAFHRMASELGLSHEEIGQKTGKERTTVTNAVRLLNLPEDLQRMVASRKLSSGHARALLKFDDQGIQREVADKCISEGWSVRQIEHFTRPAEPKSKTKPIEKPVDPNVKFAMSEMERVLGTRVKIVETGKGKGRIEIEFYNQEDLDRVYEMIVKE